MQELSFRFHNLSHPLSVLLPRPASHNRSSNRYSTSTARLPLTDTSPPFSSKPKQQPQRLFLNDPPVLESEKRSEYQKLDKETKMGQTRTAPAVAAALLFPHPTMHPLPRIYSSSRSRSKHNSKPTHPKASTVSSAQASRPPKSPPSVPNSSRSNPTSTPQTPCPPPPRCAS